MSGLARQAGKQGGLISLLGWQYIQAYQCWELAQSGASRDVVAPEAPAFAVPAEVGAVALEGGMHNVGLHTVPAHVHAPREVGLQH